MNDADAKSGAKSGEIAAGASPSTDGTQVKVKTGRLRGLDLGEVVVFNGVPFAKPPVGEFRWRPPEPPEPWQGVRDAIEVPPQCAQNRYLGVFARPGGQEDCLYLNVWMPKAPKRNKGKLPVMVWIHGGALWVGAGSDHDGRKLAAQGGTIVVTINYRLGLLGMFAHPAIIDEGQPWGNYGLMDQQAALAWVQDNIAAFGGDPDNVTIFGESSGGCSVMAHVVSPGSKGLFHHGINMSGNSPIIQPPHFACTLPGERVIQMSEDFAKAAGCDGTAKALRALTVEQILAHQTPYLPQQFFVDGHTLPTHPADAIKAGKVNGKTYTGGVTRDEWTWAVGFAENESGQVLTAEGYVEALKAYYGENAAKVLKEYPVDKYPSPSEAYSAAVTDSLFAAPMHKTLEWMSRWMPVYGYEFLDKTAPSYLEDTSFHLGAAHTYELAYLFPGYRGAEGRVTTLNPMQQKLSDEMVSLFARTHEANGAREAEWPRYDPARENFLTFVLPTARQPHERFGTVHHCSFWDNLGIY